MGSHAPFYGILYRSVPTFDQIRVPARLVLLSDLGLVVMASYGLDRLLCGDRGLGIRWVGLGALIGAGVVLVVGLPQARAVPPPERASQACVSIAVAAALLGLNGLLALLVSWRRRLGYLFVVLISVDLIALGSMVEVDPNDPTLGFQHEGVVGFLRQDTGLFRIEATTGSWQPDGALVHELYDIGGTFNPLALAPYDAYRWAVGERGSPLYNLLGVKYVLADKSSPPGDQRLVPVYTEAPDIDVYLNTAALPRVLLVYETQLVADHAGAWQAIHAEGYDPARTVVLEHGEPLTHETHDTIDEESRVALLRYDLNEIELAVRTAESVYLVLSDVYYPGWRATVDGAEADILRADYVFRAVFVPPGEHTIRMWFAPVTWYVGLAISVLTWGLVVVWQIRRWLCSRGKL